MVAKGPSAHFYLANNLLVNLDGVDLNTGPLSGDPPLGSSRRMHPGCRQDLGVQLMVVIMGSSSVRTHGTYVFKTVKSRTLLRMAYWLRLAMIVQIQKQPQAPIMSS